jgi:hypothetical protein
MQVPENMAAEPQTAAAASSGHMGEAVIEARRALRSVQDGKHSIAESAQVPCMHLCILTPAPGQRLSSMVRLWVTFHDTQSAADPSVTWLMSADRDCSKRWTAWSRCRLHGLRARCHRPRLASSWTAPRCWSSM